MFGIIGGSILATGFILVSSTVSTHKSAWSLLLHGSADSSTIKRVAASKKNDQLVIEGTVEAAGTDGTAGLPLSASDALISRRVVHRVGLEGRKVLLRSDESSVPIILKTGELQLHLAPARNLSLPVHGTEATRDEQQLPILIESASLPAHAAVAVLGAVGADGDRLVLRGAHVVALNKRGRRAAALRLLPVRVWSGALLVASGAVACAIGFARTHTR